MKTVVSNSEADTVRAAQKIAGIVKKGDVIALFGTLGMGKTVFARAFVRALGDEDEDVPSPTFTLVQTYDVTKDDVPVTVWHFDLYRLKSPEELYELGVEEAVDGISLIEWPENALPLLPPSRLEVRFDAENTGTTRRLTFVPKGKNWEKRDIPV